MKRHVIVKLARYRYPVYAKVRSFDSLRILRYGINTI